MWHGGDVEPIDRRATARHFFGKEAIAHRRGGARPETVNVLKPAFLKSRIHFRQRFNHVSRDFFN